MSLSHYSQYCEGGILHQRARSYSLCDLKDGDLAPYCRDAIAISVTTLDRAVDKGKLEADDRDAAWERFSFVTAVEDLADRDLVIESIGHGRVGGVPSHSLSDPLRQCFQ